MRLACGLAAALCFLSVNAWAAVDPAPRVPAGGGAPAVTAHELGRLYDETAPRDQRNPELAAAWYRVAAESGHPPAQYRLALLYSKGRGVARNMGKALAWLRKAAEARHAEAQYRLAAVYTRGAYGVAPDPSMGAQWLERSARQGFAEAQFALGELYAEGRGVPRNAVKALQWVSRAARGGHAQAIAVLKRVQARPPSE